MELGLRDTVALVTGGSEGIGKAAAAELAREGARVAICARRADVLEAAAAEVRTAGGGDVLAVPADVRKPEELARCVETVRETFGPITRLVNNAGTSAAGPFESVGDEDWYADLDLKLMAAIRTTRLIVPQMREAGGGRIVNITNIGAKQPGARSLPTSVSRAAGIALTKALSKELARDQILVNTVCIGLVKSAQLERRAVASFPDLPLDQAWARLGENVPLGRVAEASEVGALIAFLCSARAAYITGVAINFDGGSSGVV
ncbi:MAG TPA: SDR family oxidoreductase [Dehalococcoidia bacterium]|nr:SDR family oxidoreductase [Dehalococcoidia bacterium]